MGGGGGGTGGLLGTTALVISTVCFEVNLSFFPFGVELFICRCVGVVSQIFFAWIGGRTISIPD